MKPWQRFLSILAMIILAWALYQQIIGNWTQVRHSIKPLNHQELLGVLLVLGLMPLNFIFENQKWHLMLNFKDRRTWWQGFGSILTGTTLGLVTPNRIGSLLGRLSGPLDVGMSSMASSSFLCALLSQVTIATGGILGLGLLILGHPSWAPQWINSMVTGIVIFLIIFCLGCWLMPKGMAYINQIMSTKWKQYMVKIQSFVLNIEWIPLIGISFLKYLTFVLQYLILIEVFIPNLTLEAAIIGTTISFLFQTIIPLPPLGDVLSRSEIGILLWKNLNVEPTSIILCSVLLFVINVLLPGIVGFFFIRWQNYFKYKRA